MHVNVLTEGAPTVLQNRRLSDTHEILGANMATLPSPRIRIKALKGTCREHCFACHLESHEQRRWRAVFVSPLRHLLSHAKIRSSHNDAAHPS